MARTKQYAPIGFYDRFNEACDKTGLNNTQLASLVGLERKAIIRYKQRCSIPPIMLIYEVSRRSGKSIDWIVTGREQLWNTKKSKQLTL